MAKRTPHEWMLATVMDIERRKYLREKGKLEADNYVFDMQAKSFRRKSRIRCKTYRGK